MKWIDPRPLEILGNNAYFVFFGPVLLFFRARDKKGGWKGETGEGGGGGVWLVSRFLNSKVAAIFLSQKVVYLTMPRSSGGQFGGPVDVDGMLAALSEKLSPILFDMAK